MSLDPWLVGFIMGLIAALIRHMQIDASRAQRLKNVENRLKKIDGIDANGG